MATRKYTNHPEVISHSYHGMVVRFRKVEDAVYIPITDARNLLQLGASTIPIFQICHTCAKIEFYRNGKALSAIQHCDLENLAKRGVKATIFPDQQEKIAWMRGVCKQILAEDTLQKPHCKSFPTLNLEKSELWSKMTTLFSAFPMYVKQWKSVIQEM